MTKLSRLSPIGKVKHKDLLDSEGFFPEDKLKPNEYDLVILCDVYGMEVKGWWTGSKWYSEQQHGKITRWKPFLRWDSKGKGRLDPNERKYNKKLIPL